MIYVDMTGRCGNQFFQYAFARKLMCLHPDQSLHINFSNVERWRVKTHDDSFSDQLQYFQVMPYTSSSEAQNALQTYGSLKQNHAFRNYQFKRKVANKFKIRRLHDFALHTLNKKNIYREDESQDNIFLPVATDNIFVKGYFENSKYFNDIRDILLYEFTPRQPIPEKNQHLYDMINQRQSVCVSFRKWGEVSEQVAKERDVCGKEYYEKAIETMHQIFPDCVFVVFSNDIEWVKNNFRFKYETVFEDGTDEIWEKMRLMYSCKHFIMSTSTFCWWAQYLCRNPQKKVISPKQWYADVTKVCYLLQSEWTKISTEENNG